MGGEKGSIGYESSVVGISRIFWYFWYYFQNFSSTFGGASGGSVGSGGGGCGSSLPASETAGPGRVRVRVGAGESVAVHLGFYGHEPWTTGPRPSMEIVK